MNDSADTPQPDYTEAGADVRSVVLLMLCACDDDGYVTAYQVVARLNSGLDRLNASGEGAHLGQIGEEDAAHFEALADASEEAQFPGQIRQVAAHLKALADDSNDTLCYGLVAMNIPAIWEAPPLTAATTKTPSNTPPAVQTAGNRTRKAQEPQEQQRNKLRKTGGKDKPSELEAKVADSSATTTLPDGMTISVSAVGNTVRMSNPGGTVTVSTKNNDGSSTMVVTHPDGSTVTSASIHCAATPCAATPCAATPCAATHCAATHCAATHCISIH
jgi:hypothetical protein